MMVQNSFSAQQGDANQVRMQSKCFCSVFRLSVFVTIDKRKAPRIRLNVIGLKSSVVRLRKKYGAQMSTDCEAQYVLSTVLRFV